MDQLKFTAAETAEETKDPAETAAAAEAEAEAEDSDDDDDEDLTFFGIGGDLLEAIFPDDETEKKKKKPVEAPVPAPSTVPAAIAADVAEAVEEVKPTPAKAKPAKPAKKTSAKKPAAKKPVDVSVETPVAVEKTKLPLQHTSALLELANKKVIGESMKSEENEVGNGAAIHQIAGQLLEPTAESDESDGNENMIIIASSEVHPPSEKESNEVIVAEPEVEDDEEEEEEPEIEADEEGMFKCRPFHELVLKSHTDYFF